MKQYIYLDNKLCKRFLVASVVAVCLAYTAQWKGFMRTTARFKSRVGFGLTNSPLSTAEVLIDDVGYVCLESVKCDDCMCQTSGDVLTLYLAETLSIKANWSLLLFLLFFHKLWLVVSDNMTKYIRQHD